MSNHLTQLSTAIQSKQIKELILQAPHPELSRVSEKANIEEVGAVLTAMKEFVGGKNGAAGLALPQLGINQRAFVVKLRYWHWGRKKVNTEVFINPVIEITDHKTSKSKEECLSLKKKKFVIERPTGITVRYETLDGETKEISLCGRNARIVLHENDHLDGVLISNKSRRKKDMLTTLKSITAW